MTNREDVDFDVIIVGSGPAGMFSAIELTKKSPGLKIAILEKGPVRPPIKPEDVKISAYGWGGNGSISDGKIDLTSCAGGQLADFIGQPRFNDLMSYTDAFYLEFGGNRTLVNPFAAEHKAEVKNLQRRASRVGLNISPFPIRHLGTEGAYYVSENIRKYLQDAGVEIFLNTQAKKINPHGSYFLIDVASRELGGVSRLSARKVVVAPGRSGVEEWFMEEIKRLGIAYKVGGVDVGVRVEVKAETLKNLTDIFHEAKIHYITPKHKDKARTFCMCPYGYVVMEKYHGLTIVNGHSYENLRSPNTNFAILVTQYFTEPFNNPVVYGRGVVQQANELAGGKVLVQKLGDIWRGGRSYKRNKNDKDNTEDWKDWEVKPTLKEAEAGDITLGGIPPRHLEGVLQMLQALDEIAPGVNGAHTLLYVPEVKFYSVEVWGNSEKGFETSIPGLYVGGDGGGRTRGLLQSSMEGIIIARAIADNLRQ